MLETIVWLYRLVHPSEEQRLTKRKNQLEVELAILTERQNKRKKVLTLKEEIAKLEMDIKNVKKD